MRAGPGGSRLAVFIPGLVPSSLNFSIKRAHGTHGPASNAVCIEHFALGSCHCSDDSEQAIAMPTAGASVLPDGLRLHRIP